MLASVLFNGLLSFGMLVAVLFCLGDTDQALNTPTGFPIIEIFTQATSTNAGGTAMVSQLHTTSFPLTVVLNIEILTAWVKGVHRDRSIHARHHRRAHHRVQNDVGLCPGKGPSGLRAPISGKFCILKPSTKRKHH